MVKVSICVPTYNNVQDVERLLQSIIAQEYTDYEVNISDDSTNGEIEKLVEVYQQTVLQNKIRYAHNEKPLGHIFNWNAAIKMATGRYIKIMFSDDWFTDEKSLGKFVDMLDKNEHVNFAFCGSRQVKLDDSVDNSVHNQTHEQSYDRHASEQFIRLLTQDYRMLFLGNEIGAPSAIIYRDTEKRYGFDEKSNWASDMFLYFDILQDNPNFAYTREPLICIGEHANQYTESFSERDMRIYQDYRYMYEKYQLRESKACREYFLGKFIMKYKQNRKEAKALGISNKAFVKGMLKELVDTVCCFIRSRLSR